MRISVKDVHLLSPRVCVGMGYWNMCMEQCWSSYSTQSKTQQ